MAPSAKNIKCHTGPMSPRRGRPPEADRDELSLVALRLIEQRGFDEVTMDDVAREAGVSRRTLFRLFPTKADLVWEGVEAVLGELEARAAQVPKRTPLATWVETLLVEALRLLDDPLMAKVARRRLRLIAASPSLLTHATTGEVQAALARALEANGLALPAPPELVARALFSVGFTSLLWWAQSDGSRSAIEVLRSTLAAIARAATAR
jgi:AcrR family transcriptional regulator